MSNASNTMTIAEFERLLDVYGSDRARWPVEARAGAGQLVARDKAARRLLAEAEALDRALETAPLPTLAKEAALADRIIAAARRSPRMVPAAAGASAAAPVPARAAGNVISLPVARPRAPWHARRATGGAAGLLAASLALGLFLGLSSYSQGLVVPALEAATGLKLDTGSPRLAQIDLLDEDLL
jgi:hypothetical protein